MLKLVISELALEEENGIWAHAKALPTRHSAQDAFELLRAFQDTYCEIALSPHQQKVPGTDAYLCPVKDFAQYAVLYRFDEEFAEILHIFLLQPNIGLVA